MSFLRTIFFRKKRAPLACTMGLDDEGSPHVHTDACFVDIAPFSLVELFQSQGCEACLPAVPLIHSAVSHNPNILQITYNVTYWDGRSGWKDTHGNPGWDARQKAYATRWARRDVFTPQVVIDGVADGVGHLEGEVSEVLIKAIEARNNMDWSVGLEAGPGGVKIASERTETEVYDVLLITYTTNPETVKIEEGPNKRKELVHVNIVRDIAKIGEWAGGNKTVPLPQFGSDEQGRVVILQQGDGGPIVSALKL